MSGIDFEGTLQRLDLKPGDRFVLTAPRALSRDVIEHLQAAWEKFFDFGGARAQLLVLDEGMKLSLVGAEASQAATDVLAERRRQVEVEGWSAEHDDLGHDHGELAAAAASYAIATTDDWVQGEAPGRPDAPSCWPWAAEWWKPKDRRADLVRAGALIIAELERLDRKAVRDAG